ncbi:MAG: 4-hydroxybenzoate octaprenyltransferase [Verrucomicrobia bacterium]|nr:4-hydroxybenzoate octaprenyltransferase [Verrucomicrobiota bacterium]
MARPSSILDFPSSILPLVRRWGGFVKFSHTIFALPFALASMVVAAREQRGWPGWRTFGLILAAMVCARTCAMAFNRIVDREFDKLNPRTATRHLPAGQISLPGAWTLCAASGLGLMVVSYFINSVCFYLSPLALLVICFYSLTKRFTDFTHFYLGVALALAPVGAWLAVRGTFGLQPFILALSVVAWLVGFDIIYALQDYEFDRKQGLRSLVVRWGPKNALMFAFLSHMVMWGLLGLFGLISNFRVAYLAGLLIILGSLLLEHWLARKRSLKWINVAFFRLNALISVVFLVVTVTEVVFPRFQVFR